jgi:uncharacterized protein
VSVPPESREQAWPDEARVAVDLLRRDAYPSPLPESVEMRTTHISRVFLTDTEVFKMRRPVKLPFVDYSTPQLRRRCSEDELRLGRRLAPGVYRGLVPVCWDGVRHTIAGEGQIVDWAVQMQRLSDADTAAALLERGALDASRLDGFARRLSEFYRSDLSLPTFSVGNFAAVLRINLAELCALDGPDPRLLNEIGEFCEASLLQYESTLQNRCEQHVRDGHGDLRLEHVYFLGPSPDEIIVLDPVEFDSNLRVVDVALDAAFFAMELYAAGHPELGEVFLARFARALGDFGFYPVLALYLCHRALVRSKVAALQARESSASADRRSEKQAEAQHLLSVAAGFTRPAGNKPWIVCVGGLPGSGKTTLAESIGFFTRAPVVSSDWLRKRLGGVDLYGRGGPGLYSDDFNRRTLAALLQSAEAVVDSGRPVILDATFTRQDWRRAAFNLGKRRLLPTLFVEATCPEEVLRHRLRARQTQDSVSDAREGLLDTFLQSSEPPSEIPESHRYRVNTTVDPTESCSDSLSFLSKHCTWPHPNSLSARIS